MENEGETECAETVEAVVTLLVPAFQVVHLDSLNGTTYSVGELTAGVDWKLLRVGDKLRLEVQRTPSRVLRATLLATAPVDSVPDDPSESSTSEDAEPRTEANDAPTHPKVVPADFPRQPVLAAVSGFQPKIAVRLVDGQFTDGLSEEELFERFDACDDLVQQLTVYCRRKLAESPSMQVPTLLRRLKKGVAAKGWDLSEAEMDWIISKINVALVEAP